MSRGAWRRNAIRRIAARRRDSNDPLIDVNLHWYYAACSRRSIDALPWFDNQFKFIAPGKRTVSIENSGNGLARAIGKRNIVHAALAYIVPSGSPNGAADDFLVVLHRMGVCE